MSLISVYSTHVSVDVPQNIKFVPCSACLPTFNSLVMKMCSVKLYFLIGQYSFSVIHIIIFATFFTFLQEVCNLITLRC